ncbi:MAG: hypothetical protein JWN14_3346, partial [Chthonomonadales bacterium]|nr:hypothetical protein [Chthonomonadales bacterium]
MKRFLAFILVPLLLLAGRGAQAAPPIPPSPTTWITDTAGFLSESARQMLDTRLEAYEHASGHQVLVWIGKTTGETPMEDWTAHAFQAWHVGRKGLDDGLVLFLFAADHKARIEVGYGLEGQFPDAVASRILREAIIPRIQANDHDGAVTAGLDRLIATLGGKAATPTVASAPTQPLGWFQMLLLVLAVIALLLLAIRYPALAWMLLS